MRAPAAPQSCDTPFAPLHAQKASGASTTRTPLWFFDIMDKRTIFLAAHNSLQGTFIIEVKHHNRQVIILAKRERGAVHNLQPHIQRPHIAQFLELAGLWITHGIIGIDAIHLGCFEQYLSIEFDGAQGCGGIGGKEGIAVSGGLSVEYNKIVEKENICFTEPAQVGNTAMQIE